MDVGGRGMKVGIWDEEGEVMDRYEGGSEVDKGVERVMGKMEKYVGDMVGE